MIDPNDSSTWQPSCLDIEVTSACNLGCPYCYLGRPRSQHMSDETADEVVEHLVRSRGCTWPPGLNIYGGEPFLNFPIVQRLTVTTGKRLPGAQITIFTNGATATPEQVAWCLSRGVFPKRSTAGCPEAAEHTRPGDYTTRWLEEGKLWQDYGVSHRLTVTPATARYVAQSVRWLHSQGYYGPVDLAADDYAAWSREEIDQYAASLASLATECIWQYRLGKMLAIENFINYSRSISAGQMVLGCGAGWETQGVTADGWLVPCHRFFRAPRKSPLCQTRLSDILSGRSKVDFGPEHAAWLSDAYHGKESPGCHGCLARRCCQHGCLHVSLAAPSTKARCTFTNLYAQFSTYVMNALGENWWMRAPTPCDVTEGTLYYA